MKKNRRLLALLLAFTMIISVCPQTQLIDVSADDDTPYCISVGRPVYASSQNGGEAPENGVDGDNGTRWQAANNDVNEWFYVDLGKTADIDHIYINWEAAYAKSYEIQFSDDEENWRTVYRKGKGASTGSGGETETQTMTISRGTISQKNEKYVSTLSWSSVDGVDHYYVYLDNVEDNNPAYAADGWPFTGNWGTGTSYEAWIQEGIHTYTVVAYDANNAEIASASIDIDSSEVEVTTEAGGNEGETTDITKQTITFDDLTAEEKQARYVKIVCTERQLEAYGCSFYEFQVYGANGVVKRPADYGTNLALNKPVECSGIRDEWWMYDSEGNLLEDAVNNVKAENAVDGNTSTSFTSYQGDDQWLYVDLEDEYTIGRIVVNWTTDGGKIYDVQVSADAKNWTTVHRMTKGYASMVDNFTLYKEGVRYVRVLAYTKVESGSGVGIKELSVYEYREGDSKENETIEDLPVRQIINNANGKGSYVSGEMYNEKNKLPTFINEDNIQVPIDSNSWWSSAMVQTYSNLLCITPFKAKFSNKGLGVLTATSGWVGTRKETDLGTDQSSETGIDFHVSTDNFETSTGYDRVENYGDYSVEIGHLDGNGLQMKSTFVKGSPYIFNDFCDNTTVFISSTTIDEIFDGNGNEILMNSKDEITTDHIGFKSLDDENTKAGNEGAYYCINVPEGTTFKTMVAGSNYKIKITFPSSEDNYMSIAAMTNKDDIEEYYKHGYAFVTDSYIGYTYNQDNSKIITTYQLTTELKRNGFSNVTMQAMFPHQWKHSTDDENLVATYTSVRGNMKAIWANTFTTTQQFAGLLPTFATPDSDMFDTEEMVDYLHSVVASKVNTAPVDDAYWEGKNVHPLAISAIMADQLGETEIKEQLLKKLKSIMEDWFTYDGGDDKCYLIYNKDWGTVYYPNSAYGANAAICDHHFTYGYFMFGAAVLATYDKEFYNDYKDMIEILVRDYACPTDDDSMFCKFRAFDQYAGHSWAGGYADSDSGNNQESASEALFSWVGMYLWGEVTQNQTYIDAGAYGFTTEMDAVEQYWFDYDEDNWLDEYPFQAAGQIYGASMGYGTYFGGQPVYVFGIQWLPISEYLTNYGMNQEKCAKIYQGLEDDTAYAQNIEKKIYEDLVAQGKQEEADEWHNWENYVTPDNGWQHITWPFLSQTNPQSAYEKFEANVSAVQTEDRANTLWFIAAMDQLGYRTNDYVVTGNITGSVYCKEENGVKSYTAEVWNPTQESQTVTVKKLDGTVVGTASVGSKALVSFPIEENNFALTQVSTPVIKATALADGTVVDNVTGEKTFDDTQMAELSCEDSDATIYYTTDGSIPTAQSQKYEGKILVSSNMTLKAVAIKDGCIDSAYAAAAFKIEGDVIESSENLALGKTVTASSENGADVATNAVDGQSGTKWQSQENNDEYIQIDLDSVETINTVKITWETAFAEKYQIQVSIDGENWTTVAEENGLVGEMTTTFAATKAQYVRMQGIKRGTQYGYAIYEFEVYGALQAKAPVISPISGIYDGSQTVTMETTVKGAEIKYTLDGSDPTEDSATYVGPIEISKATRVKAVTYRKGMILSDVTQSDVIIAGTVSLNMSSATIAIDRTKQLSALTDQQVTWTSSDSTVATVSEDGLVTGKKEGSVTITATIENGKTAECKVTVTLPIHITSIEFKTPELEIKNKTSETLELIINPENTTDDTTVIWKSSDETILKVNDNGTITAKAEGQATVTATVGTHTAECVVTVGPAATAAEMIVSKKYNVALGKTVTVFPNKQPNEGGSESNITDGNITGLHIATAFTTPNTYYQIDLGDAYDASTLDQIAVKYRENNPGDTPVNGYEIQYSTNGVDFTTVKSVDGSAVVDACENNDCMDVQDMTGVSGAVRYIRFYYPDSYQWGVQVQEIGVLSTEQNQATVELQYCDNPADLTVISEAYSQITYTITAGENQEDYKYIVFLDGIKVSDLIDAGTYKIDNVEAGTHTVKVISYYNKLTSEGIVKEIEVDDGSLKAYVNTVRNISKGCDITVDTVYEGEGNQNVSSLVDGQFSQDNGICVHTEHGVQTATINMDLGEAYAKERIDEFLIAFKADNTNATYYTVEFSSDGETYEQVISVENAAYKDVLENKFDPTVYSQDTVRYVRINLLDGNYNWGYQISEVAIMGGEEFMPQEAEGLSVTSPEYNTIQVEWLINTNGQLYDVYVDNAIKKMNVTAGTYVLTSIAAGTHTVKVISKLNGIESKGVTVEVVVEANPETTTKETVETTKAIETLETSTEKTGVDESSSENVDESSSENVDESSTENMDEPSSGSEESTEKSDMPEPTNAPVGGEQTTNSPAAGQTTNDAAAGQTTVDSQGQNVNTTDTASNVKVGSTKVKKVVKKKTAKKASLTLKSVKGASGYQISVSTAKKFKKKTTVTKTFTKRKVKFNLNSKKLKGKKTYYCRARAYKKVNGKKVFGKWTKAKKIKIK